MDAILEVRGLTKRFQGLVAIDRVSFARAREILGLIGPNGAGKTTLVSLISGTLAADRGRVPFEGAHRSSARLSPRPLGIGRTFQVMRPFPGLTVLDNVAVGALFGLGRRAPLAAAREEAQPLAFTWSA